VGVSAGLDFFQWTSQVDPGNGGTDSAGGACNDLQRDRVIVRGAGIFALFAGVDLGTVNDNSTRGRDAEADLVTVDAEYGDGDVGADLEGF
jgi:hypothetical protein